MFRNFSWIIENKLAAMARPNSVSEDFEFLIDNGINVIVSFTERPLDRYLLEHFHFEYLHLPITDFSIPTFKQIDEFINFTSQFDNKKRVVVHCESGFGRTGTMSAIYFVYKGYSAFEAIKLIRQKRPGSIETKEQENIVFEFEKKNLSY